MMTQSEKDYKAWDDLFYDLYRSNPASLTKESEIELILDREEFESALLKAKEELDATQTITS